MTIGRREAGLRVAAIACLAGLALVQVVELPYSLARGGSLWLVSGLVVAACLALALVLVTADGAGGRAAWRAVAALGTVVVVGWVVTRLAAVAGMAASAGHWTTRPGLASALLGATAVALAAVGAGARPSRETAIAMAGGLGVVGALAPGAAAFVVATSPGPGHHGGGQPIFKPGFGGHAGHYVYPDAVPPHLPSWALALALGAAAALLYAGGAALHRRCPERLRLGGPVRLMVGVLACGAALGSHAEAASAHAVLLQASPRAGTSPATAPPRVVLRFSEPVEILRAGDVSVVDARGRVVNDGRAQTEARDPRVVAIPLRTRLEPESYTVRWRAISADSHTVTGALVFGVAGARLKPPVLRPAGGLSETAAPAVDARFAELATLMLLLALVVFRAAVWGPAAASAGAATLEAGRRAYWRAFWSVAALAGVAEAWVLAAKSAVAYGTSLGAAFADPTTAYRLVAASRFGDLLGWRGALLCALVAVGFWEWTAERARPAAPAGRRAPQAALAALSLGALITIATQGHASQAPVAPLSVAVDSVHLAAVGVWIGGLPCLLFVLSAAPRPQARASLRRFSRLAAVAFAAVAATGVLRALGELSSPAQLWDTAYGHSLLAKVALLVPIAALALRTRRAMTAGAVRTVCRNVQVEVVVGATVILVAALLVAQAPGR